MKKLISFFSIVIVLSVFTLASAQTEYRYVGAGKCKMCHKGAKKGEQFEKWQGSKHAKAFETLKSSDAKKVADKMKIADASKAKECLKCHTTGYGEPEGAFAKTYTMDDGVSCEACHGPGSVYKKMSIMKSKKKFLASGGIVPDETVCIKCHNEKSPTFKPFNFAERVKEIAHPIPAK